MNIFKSHFWYNKRQRNGILFLVILIVILQAIYFFINYSSNDKKTIDVSDIDSYQIQIDSLKDIKQRDKKEKIYPFNPNYITDFKGYQLGMSTKEIDKLLKFRSSGKFVNSAKEFQNTTGVNDSLLAIIAPYFKFPDWVNQKTAKKNTTTPNVNAKNSKQIITNHDINLVTANQLEKLNGIGDKLSKRIISYRNLLNGFSFNDQIYDVYYLDKEIANQVLQNYWVIQKPVIKKLNINESSFKELLHLPYLNYNLTKKIFNFRNKNGDFSSLEDLKKIDSFPINKFERIALYLTVD